jgi:hypothetical protein
LNLALRYTLGSGTSSLGLRVDLRPGDWRHGVNAAELAKIKEAGVAAALQYLTEQASTKP